MPHKKKVNKLKKQECQDILLRLDNAKESQYYKHVELRLKFIDESDKSR